MNTGPNVPSRKPTTYGKKDRPPPTLITQAHGPGQAAYLQHRENRAPATPSRRLSSRDGHDPRSGGAISVKRRKIDHVITLDDDDDDEVLEVSRPLYTTHVSTLQEQRHPVRSEQSRMSIGSGSTISDFRPLQSKSEFREVDGFLKSSQKKPRKSSSNTPKGDLRHSPFGGGALSNSPGAHANRQAILQDFQQGEAKQSPTRRDSPGSKLGPVTSHFFPNARINESTSEQMAQQPTSVENAYLRTQHRSAPKQTQTATDSYSADELAITPPQPGSRSPSKQKQKQAANSGVRRNARGKVVEEAWPLLFARSSDFEGNGSMSEDGRATLVLKSKKDEGLRVQMWEAVDGCYDTPIIILPKDINRVIADGTSRIRLQGPRRHDGSSRIFDLEFANTPEFFFFLNDHASSMTLTGAYLAKSEYEI
jgi:sentrin-specific protease 7